MDASEFAKVSFRRVLAAGQKLPRDTDKGGPSRGHPYIAEAAAQWVSDAESTLASVFPASHAIWLRWRAALKDAEGAATWRLSEAGTIHTLRGVFATAADRVEAGHVGTVQESVRAETVVELLEQAAEYCRRKELVAATVVAGGALETHLRHLCEKNGLTWTGEGSISKYDQAIAQARNSGTHEVYSATRSKDVTAWGGRRNDAAHQPADYAPEARTVDLMIEGIRGFVHETSSGL